MHFFPTRPLALATLALLVGVCAAAAPSRADEPGAGQLLDAQLRDLDDHPLRLRSLLEKEGTLLVVLHQDRKSSDQNQEFKDQLGKLAESPAGRARMRLVALADAGGYDFWPARGYVKDALRPLRDAGWALVLADWQGAVRKKYAIPAGQSAVFVVTTGSGSSELRAFRRGVLGKEDASQLLQMIAGMLAN